MQAHLADFSLSIHTCGLDHLDNLEQEAKLGHTMTSHGNLAPKSGQKCQANDLDDGEVNFSPAVFLSVLQS